MEFLQSADRAVSVFFGGIDCGIIDFLMVLFSTVTEFGAAYIVLALCLFIFVKDRKQAVTVLAALLIGFLLCHVLKDIFDRTRPYIELGIDIIVSPPFGSSFPSAHSATSFSVASATFLLYRKKLPILAVGTVIFAAIVAFSRIWLCVHYLSDVVVGSAVGIVTGIITVLLFGKIQDKFFMKTDRDR